VSGGSGPAPGRGYDPPIVRKSTVVIVALWACAVGDAAWDATGLRADEFTKGMPLGFGVALVVIPLAFFPVAASTAKRSPLFVPSLARWIDARAGEGATADFLRRWRPLLMFAAVAAVHAVVLGTRLANAGNATHEWWMVGFESALSAGLALAHVILRRRGVPGA
jgi:hypothetical protein